MKEFNFSKKRKAQLYTIITTLLLCVSACAFSSFDTHADSGSVAVSSLYGFNTSTMGITSCWNKSDFLNSSLNDTERDLVISSLNMEGSPNYTGQLVYFDGDTSNGEYTLPQTFTYDGQSYNISDFPYFVFRYNSSNSQYRLQVVQDVSKIHGNNGNYVTTDANYYNNYVGFTFQLFPNNVGTILGRVGKNDTWSSNGLYSPLYASTGFIFSNFPMYTVDLNGITNTTEQIKGHISDGYIEYWYALAGLYNYGNYNDILSDNINYLLTDSNNGEGYSNPITDESYGSSDDEFDGDSSNYLYLDDCDISYSCTGNTNGNIVCMGKLNDYQKEHLDEFLVVYNFTFDVKGYQVNSQDNESSLGNKLEFSKNYSYQQTLSDFYNNSSSKVFTLKDIEQNTSTTDITADGWTNGWPGSEYGNLYQLFTYMNNNLSSSGDITARLPFKYIKCSLKTTMFVTLADVNLDNLTDSNIRSGSYSETYNFVKGTSSLNSDGILNNSNPVQSNSSGSIDSNEDLASLTTQGGVSGNDMPSSNNNGNGIGSGYYGDNNIIINNNPTFNNSSNGSGSNGSLSQSGGSPSNSGLFSTLVDFVKGDTESTSESVSEMVDSDGWISVINSYYTFIPEKFWTLLFGVLGTCIGIMVVAFIISIVLRFIS